MQISIVELDVKPPGQTGRAKRLRSRGLMPDPAKTVKRETDQLDHAAGA